jgi:hypothetical protein
MNAVFVLLAAYMCWLALLLWIAFGQIWRKYSTPSRAGQSLRYVLTDDRDDCDHDLLWHTQLPTLEFLGSAGSCGVSMARMTKLYRDFARTYPELCDGSNFWDWLDALQNAAVAVHCRAGAMIAITEKGLFVLKDLEDTHYEMMVRQDASSSI